MIVEKAGVLVNKDKKVLGWVNKGDEVETKDGDTICSHPKTAEKLGIKEQYEALKAENAPKKEPKAKAEGTRTRIAVPKEGTYTVVRKPGSADEDNERGRILTKLFSNTDFAVFFKDTPEKFSHPSREGEVKEFATTGLVAYCIKRGMITVDGAMAKAA